MFQNDTDDDVIITAVHYLVQERYAYRDDGAVCPTMCFSLRTTGQVLVDIHMITSTHGTTKKQQPHHHMHKKGNYTDFNLEMNCRSEKCINSDRNSI
jgi:hypothetical protein